MENLSQFWSDLSNWDLVGIIGGVLLFSTVFEKLFNIEFIGRRICRGVWKITRVVCKRLVTQDEIDSAKEYLFGSHRIEAKLEKMSVEAADHDSRRTDEYADIINSLSAVEKEITLNGGGSIKDAVVRLLRHNEEKWSLISVMHSIQTRMLIRLDILDAVDGRMTFELSSDLAVTKISPSFLRKFGWTERDIIGTDWEFCIGKRSLDDVKFRWERSVRKHTTYQNEQWILDSDQVEHFCSVRGYPMEDETGALLGFFGTVEMIKPADNQ